MLRLLPILVLVTPAIAGKASDGAAAKSGIPAISVLPEGSELKGVMLPRYDENHKLTGVLKAGAVKLVSATRIEGRQVTVESFNPNQTLQARIDLVTATYDQPEATASGIINSRAPVVIRSESGNATGSGICYSLATKKGFLLGPATLTIHQPPPETTMNPKTTPLRATAALGVSLLTQAVSAAPPPPITPADKAAVHADAASKAPAAAAAAAETKTAIGKDLTDSSAAAKSAESFLAQNNLPAIPADEVPAPAVPFEFKSGPGDTIINCEGGFYFDPDEGVFVFLKNVVVKDPRFHLKAKDQVKVFFGKKPETADKEEVVDPEKDKTGLGGGLGKKFGKPEKIIATGAVLFEQKQTEPGNEPISGSGAIFSYNIKDDQIIISGGKPWFTQPPSTYLRAVEPDLILRISPKAGRAITEGHWEIGGNIEEKK